MQGPWQWQGNGDIKGPWQANQRKEHETMKGSYTITIYRQFSFILEAMVNNDNIYSNLLAWRDMHIKRVYGLSKTKGEYESKAWDKPKLLEDQSQDKEKKAKRWWLES